MLPHMHWITRVIKVFNVLKTVATLSTLVRTCNVTSITIALALMPFARERLKIPTVNPFNNALIFEMTRVKRDRQTKLSYALFRMKPITTTDLTLLVQGSAVLTSSDTNASHGQHLR
jgi:hypothetical protein